MRERGRDAGRGAGAGVAPRGDAEAVRRVRGRAGGWGVRPRGEVAGVVGVGAGGVAALFGVPAAPADFFEVDVGVDAGAVAAAAAAFERADDEAARFGGGDAAEAGDGGGEVAHYVADGERAVGQQDVREVVFGEEVGGDGPGGVEAREVVAVVVEREAAALGLVLRFCVVDGVLEVDVGVNVGGAGWGSGRRGGGVALVVVVVVVEGLGWQRRGDGVGGRG